MIGALERSAGGHADTARWAGAVALPLVRGFRAFWRGEYAACAEGLHAARYIVNQGFSKMMESLVAERLVDYDQGTSTATLTDAGRRFSES